ncbi:MAG TPA: nicotinate-nucleotide--dimethylbenzimidazole phosphoribosyltransferase [Ruminococcaceae bacterium]|nr:nicotinate-nucleotide--dimethylbenzimidazole phosphoribosyltransferase [Oscillospiraceae bacterium]
MNIEKLISKIAPPDENAAALCKQRWDSIAKPLFSLGLLEKAVIKISALTENPLYKINKRAVVIMCADNGVVAQGVTQTDSSVTAIVARNFTTGDTSVCKMAKLARCTVVPVDIGIAADMSDCNIINKKIAYGTNDITICAAMTREQCENAILTGIEIVRDLKAQGYKLIATGEMGIGNTTTSSAVTAVLLNKKPKDVTGRGAGLSSDGLMRKIAAINKAIVHNKPDKSNPVDVLAKVGGYDIAGLAGVFLGGALYNVPVIIDGFISAAAALAAARLCPNAAKAMLASHISAEPAGQLILGELGLKPFIAAEMCLGEGTGAVAAIPILDMAYAVYEEMSTFADINIDNYVPLK